MKDNTFRTAFYLVLVSNFLWLGLLFGLAIKKGENKIEEPKNQIIVEMDKSCFDQFQNNLDKAIYVKLYFKDK